MCAIKVLGATQSDTLFVAFGCTNCANVKGPVKPNLDLKCKRCRGEASTVAIPDIDPVDISGEEIEKVKSLYYLGNFIRQGGGCFHATTARMRSAWKRFREILPILAYCGLSLKTCGYAYNAHMHSVLLHVSEMWAATQENVSSQSQ